MQPYEARMVKANPKLEGFVDIKTSPGAFFKKFSNQKDETLVIAFIKLERLAF